MELFVLKLDQHAPRFTISEKDPNSLTSNFRQACNRRENISCTLMDSFYYLPNPDEKNKIPGKNLSKLVKLQNLVAKYGKFALRS